MIDFEGIPKRVCSDRKLREEFLRNPLKVTEELLRESDIASATGLHQSRSEPHEYSATLLPYTEAADALTCVSR